MQPQYSCSTLESRNKIFGCTVQELYITFYPLDPTRTGPCCAPSACNPCRFSPDQRLHLSNPRFQIQKYRKKIQSSFNPEQQPGPTNPAIIQSTLRASVQHTGRLTVAGMYKNCTKEESPEIGI